MYRERAWGGAGRGVDPGVDVFRMGPSLAHQVDRAQQLIGRSLAWLRAVPGHGASLNGGYRSVTRTNA
jgi:hypothetical protein